MGVLDLFNLADKTALITGANRGIGQAVALALAEAGADIVGLNRSEDDGGTGDAVRALGRMYTHVPTDLNVAQIKEINSLVAELPPLDILVNNAGIIRRVPLLDFDESDWDDVLQVNLRAVFFLSQAVARTMKTRGSGKIIHIASVLSYQGGIRVPSYTASKHGMLGLVRAMANELAPFNVHVNAIAPGYIVTDNTEPLRADSSRYDVITGRIPAGRWGTPNDLKGAAVFLASSASDYMHGATITVDGGWLAR